MAHILLSNSVQLWRYQYFKIILFIFSTTTILVSCNSEEEGHCIWYDECFASSLTEKPINCEYHGPAKVLNDSKAVEVLRSLCPSLVKNSTAPRTCCSSSQVNTFYTNIIVATQLFARCPSCSFNFVEMQCALTCSPHQSKYIYPVSFQEEDNKTAIDMINYYMKVSYANKLFDSCKNVQFPQNNEKVISLMCGGLSSRDCTVQDWLTFLGNTDNGQTPFTINFLLTNETEVTKDNTTLIPFETPVIPCNQSLSEEQPACSCSDCEMSCPPMPAPPPPKTPWLVFGIDGMLLIMLLLYVGVVVVLVIAMFVYHVVFDRHTIDPADKSIEINDKAPTLLNLHGSDVSCLEKTGAKVEDAFVSAFTSWGIFCARRPVLILGLGILISGSLCLGCLKFQVTTDPVMLWSSPTSASRIQKDFFDKHFGPFYRTEQLIIKNLRNSSNFSVLLPQANDPIDVGPVYHLEFLNQVLDLQKQIEDLSVWYEPWNRTISLPDICFTPLSPENTNCTIMSVLNYFQNDPIELNKVVMEPEFQLFPIANYLTHLKYCLQAPTSLLDPSFESPCMGTFGGPVNPWVVLGGYSGYDYLESTALVITFVVTNVAEGHPNGNETLDVALAWEKEFINLLKNYQNPNFSLAFISERSIQDEIDRESKSDIFTIIISYVTMFIYVSLTLGQYQTCGAQLLVDSKITLGLCGVTIVILSVVASIGVWSLFNISATLFIIEVIPFLVLAVGVDNIFILVQAYQRDKHTFANESTDQRIGRALGKVGPSMFLSSIAETCCFFIGALSTMPAVKIFSLYAALAVLFDFLLQITCFVGLLSLDARRQKAGRIDILCCIKGLDESDKLKHKEGFLFKFFRKYYAPIIVNTWVRFTVVLVFLGWLFTSIAMIPKVQIGLDQKLSMPEDSYVLQYFGNQTTYLSVGPPVYFVIKGDFDYTSNEKQNVICGSFGCHQDSMLNQIFQASRQPAIDYIAVPASAWIDDYFAWIQPSIRQTCCRVYNDTGNFCPSTDVSESCMPCNVTIIQHRPVANDFIKYLQFFLKDNPGINCANGGHAAYGSAVEIINHNSIATSYFSTYHTVLKTSTDFISALSQARELSDNITRTINIPGVEVFPYSIFYVFYDQYLTIVMDTVKNLLYSLAAIFVVTALFMGLNFHSAIIVAITITMIIVDLLALMYWWQIELNAISLVNLVMAIGISVEFCSHITHAFTTSTQTSRVSRAQEAVTNMGSSVFSGITLTKFGGILVLAFAKSQIFKVYYFRMYLGIVLFGAAHGLIFLPAFLSYLGPPANKLKMQKEMHNTSEKDSYGAVDNPLMKNRFEKL